MTAKKRLFIALPVSSNFQSEALSFQKEHRDLAVRWLFGHNLHITIIPPWYEEDEEKVIDILEKLKNKISQFPINIQFKKISFGPNPGNPRLIWAEAEAPSSLIELKRIIEHELVSQKIIPPPEIRPFRLHVTLARFHPDTKFSSGLNVNISWPENIDSLVLMESILTITHAEYKVIYKI